MRPEHFGRADLGELQGNARIALVLQQGERVGHIFCGQGAAVGKLGFRPQGKGHRQPVIGHIRGFGHQAIHRIGLIPGPHHQGVEQERQALGRIALQDVVVEAVEGDPPFGANHRNAPAFGGIWVHIVKVGKVCRILQISKGRQPMARCGLKARGPGQGQRRTEAYGNGFDHCLIFAALASSYHQMFGKPTANSGSGSGWEYLSQRAIREALRVQPGMR